MAKSLYYRWFGFGKMPAAIRSELTQEGIIFIDDGLTGSVTYHNFHRPGKTSSWERRGLVGAVALTKVRLLALWGSNPLINAPLTDPRLKQMHFSIEKVDGLSVGFDAALFHPDWSGTIEYRFRTEQAERLLKLIQDQLELTN